MENLNAFYLHVLQPNGKFKCFLWVSSEQKRKSKNKCKHTKGRR